MTLPDLMLLAIGLSMDAFACAVCKGLALKKMTFKSAAVVGLWFGGFQALMPLIGYLIGAQFADRITHFDHWIAFGLLGLIGANMIREALGADDKEADAQQNHGAALSFKSMLTLAIATSIDALAVGVTFAFTGAYHSIGLSVTIIGVVTAALSMLGVMAGSLFGARYEKKAELLGGVILILLGVKILFEHLGIF